MVKLFRARIWGKAWHWLRSFLTDRHIRVVDQNMHSGWFTTSAGVPQGSPLSPFLFLVYINDLSDCAKNPRSGRVEAVILLYADDIACWGTRTGSHGTADLNRTLARIHTWANDWRLAFNTVKSQAVAFSNRHHHCEDIHVRLGPVKLRYVDSYHYLGLTFQSSLRWHAHAKKVLNKITKSSAFICSWITSDGPDVMMCRGGYRGLHIPG